MTRSCHLMDFRRHIDLRFGASFQSLTDPQIKKVYSIAKGITWTNDVPTMWLFLDENPYLLAYLYHQATIIQDTKESLSQGPAFPWGHSGWGFFMGSVWSVVMQQIDPSLGYSLVALLGAFSLGWKKWSQWRTQRASHDNMPQITQGDGGSLVKAPRLPLAQHNNTKEKEPPHD
jgi:hypothetical protein